MTIKIKSVTILLPDGMDVEVADDVLTVKRIAFVPQCQASAQLEQALRQARAQTVSMQSQMGGATIAYNGTMQDMSDNVARFGQSTAMPPQYHK